MHFSVERVFKIDDKSMVCNAILCISATETIKINVSDL